LFFPFDQNIESFMKKPKKQKAFFKKREAVCFIQKKKRGVSQKPKKQAASNNAFSPSFSHRKKEENHCFCG